MRYIEAKFTIIPSADDANDLLAALIADAGFESFDSNGEHLLAYAQTSLFNETELRHLIEEFPMTDVTISYTLSDVEDQNWNATWEQEGFQPITIGNECIIYDARHPITPEQLPKDKNSNATLLIAIETHQAFGTGTHQTTQMIVGRLLHLQLSGKRLLDCGCGTGILSIVAAKCGATDIVGYDIDEWSVRNTQHNATLNGVSDQITIMEGDSSVLSHVNGLFDVVVANINRNILLADIPHFADVMQPHGHLILSGFYEDDAPLLIEEATKYRLVELCRNVTDGWTCLEFVRMMTDK